MIVALNGRPAELRDGASVAEAIAVAGVAGAERGVAAAVDGAVVPRSQWESVVLTEGAEVEVVKAVQGG